MNAERYRIRTVAKGAHIHECLDCGAVVAERARHDAWHALHDVVKALAVLDELEARARDTN